MTHASVTEATVLISRRSCDKIVALTAGDEPQSDEKVRCPLIGQLVSQVLSHTSSLDEAVSAAAEPRLTSGITHLECARGRRDTGSILATQGATWRRR